jgi:hypothetical protein
MIARKVDRFAVVPEEDSRFVESTIARTPLSLAASGGCRLQSLQKKLVRGVDVLNPEVEDGARMIELRRFRRAKHQAHSAAVKESQVARREEQWQTQAVTVKCHGALEVVNNDGNLADASDSKDCRCAAHVDLPPRAELLA